MPTLLLLPATAFDGSVAPASVVCGLEMRDREARVLPEIVVIGIVGGLGVVAVVVVVKRLGGGGCRNTQATRPRSPPCLIEPTTLHGFAPAHLVSMAVQRK